MGDLVSRAGEILCGRTTVSDDLKSRIRWALHTSMLNLIEEHPLKVLYSESEFQLQPGVQDYPLESDLHKLNAPSVYCQMSNGEVYEPSYVDNEAYVSRGGRRFTQRVSKIAGYCLLNRDRDDGCIYMRTFPDISESGTTLKYGYYAVPKDMHDLLDADKIDQRLSDHIAFVILHGALIDFTDLLHQDQVATQLAKYQDGIRKLGKQVDPVVGNARQMQPARLRPNFIGGPYFEQSFYGTFNPRPDIV